MLLIARVTEGRFLDCWTSGGNHKIVDPQILPRFWSLYQRKGSVPFKVRLLSDIKNFVTLFRMDVQNTRMIPRLRDDDSLEANIPFEQLLVMLVGFTHHDDTVNHAAMDIEMVTKGQFPNFQRVPISELSWYSPRRQEVLQGDEVSILEGFSDIVQKEDPDMIDTYAGGRFDWRAINARARVNNVKLNIGRLGDAPYVRAKERRYGKFRGFDYYVMFTGRISFDVYPEVRQDTSLTGKVKNKQLKTVAKHMFPEAEIIEVDRARLDQLTAKERADYCLSDARATYMLAEHHLAILKMLATELRAPLELIIRRSPSHIGNYIYGYAFKQMNVVSDGANFQRFRGILWDE